ncbi:MAG: L-serine ammonia-lyase, iron-sulfur-dependent, subunit alpha, partial [Lachnospiraceae bacterium]|nr:L-serine ammonia-lyase, iron-sulfur-dependent, subunit alpha [Lachnospiraceae bacterium]
MIGLPIAIALGAICGKPELELEVLRYVSPEYVELGKNMIDGGRISIRLKDGISEKLYIEVEMTAGEHQAKAIIAGSHTAFAYMEKDGETLLNEFSKESSGGQCGDSAPQLTLAKVWEFATTSPLDEIRFIMETRRVNKAAAEQSFTGHYGHSVGRTLHCERQRYVMGDSIFSRILSYTSAACDARMAGACIPVMSNSGSGNQGIAATLPVVIYAEESFASEEKTIRSLTLSHLTAIYIKQSLGRLSALCGCVVAATGSGCGIAYLMGGGYPEISATVKNMVANLTGMICDGAKPSCAMKLTSGVSTAVISAIMAMEGHCATPVEGIIEADVDNTIRN